MKKNSLKDKILKNVDMQVGAGSSLVFVRRTYDKREQHRPSPGPSRLY